MIDNFNKKTEVRPMPIESTEILRVETKTGLEKIDKSVKVTQKTTEKREQLQNQIEAEKYRKEYESLILDLAKTKKKPEEMRQMDVYEFSRFCDELADDQRIKGFWDKAKLSGFDETNLKIAGAAGTLFYLGTKKTGAEAFGMGAKAAGIFGVLTNSYILKGVKWGMEKVGECGYKGLLRTPVQAIYGVASGELWTEIGKMGHGGNPADYLWNDKTWQSRVKETFKSGDVLKAPEKFTDYMDGDLQGVWAVISGYKDFPEKMTLKKIETSAEFVFRSMQASMTMEEIQQFVADLKTNKWEKNPKMLRRAMMTSTSMGISQFFMEKASPAHREEFQKQLETLSHAPQRVSTFTDEDLQKKFPGIAGDKLTEILKDPERKQGVRAALGIGFSGMAISVYLIVSLFTRMAMTGKKYLFDKPKAFIKGIGKNKEMVDPKKMEATQFGNAILAKKYGKALDVLEKNFIISPRQRDMIEHHRDKKRILENLQKNNVFNGTREDGTRVAKDIAKSHNIEGFDDVNKIFDDRVSDEIKKAKTLLEKVAKEGKNNAKKIEKGKYDFVEHAGDIDEVTDAIGLVKGLNIADQIRQQKNRQAKLKIVWDNVAADVPQSA